MSYLTIPLKYDGENLKPLIPVKLNKSQKLLLIIEEKPSKILNKKKYSLRGLKYKFENPFDSIPESQWEFNK
jgi:hypothetical protein